MAGVSIAAAEDLASLEFFTDIPAGDLAVLAAKLQPLHAVPGEVLMRQGEQAISFAVIASGRVEIRHVGSDGQVLVADLPAGLIVGEIALLRRARRTATVTAKDHVRGYLGYRDAFECMLAMPILAERMVHTARQRLAALITPIPVTANDGTELFLRPVLPGNAERFVEGSAAFSRETLYRRFLSAGAPTTAQLAYLFEVDYVDRFVWVVTAGVDGPIVGDARFVRDADNPASAEIALTVADAYQGRGIGTLLLGVLAVAACVDDIQQFHALLLADNVAARALGDKFHTRWEPEEPGVLTTIMAIPRLEDLPIELRAYPQSTMWRASSSTPSTEATRPIRFSPLDPGYGVPLRGSRGAGPVARC